jgi:hypothetical protein
MFVQVAQRLVKEHVEVLAKGYAVTIVMLHVN